MAKVNFLMEEFNCGQLVFFVVVKKTNTNMNNRSTTTSRQILTKYLSWALVKKKIFSFLN
jgi:hypothetical protein